MTQEIDLFFSSVFNTRTQKKCKKGKHFKPEMTSELDWIFPRMKHPSKLWRLCSYGVVGAVGFVSKIIIGKDFNGKEKFFFMASRTNSVSFFISVFLVTFFSFPLFPSLSLRRTLRKRHFAMYTCNIRVYVHKFQITCYQNIPTPKRGKQVYK